MNFRLWLEYVDKPWIGIIDPYDAIHASDTEEDHNKLWPTEQKRWRYRPGTGMVTLWWDANDEEKYIITNWLDFHGGRVNKIIKAYG